MLEGVHGAKITLEADTMARIGRHPSLVTFHGISRSPQGTAVLVVELAKQGSLDSLLLRHKGNVSLQVKLAMAAQICEGMIAMQTEGIIHRDLAARNILAFAFSPLDPSVVVVKVSDYGLSIPDDPSMGGSRPGAATVSGEGRPFRYMPPEALCVPYGAPRAWSQASDVWAFGVTLWEILQECDEGCGPWMAPWHDEEQVKAALTAGQTLTRPPGCPPPVDAILRQCWARDPTDRPTFSTLQRRIGEVRIAIAEASSAASWRVQAEAAITERDHLRLLAAVGRAPGGAESERERSRWEEEKACLISEALSSMQERESLCPYMVITAL